LANPYGIGQNFWGRQGFIAVALGKLFSGKAMEISGDGNTIRDFIYIDDVIQACHLLALTRCEEDIFNVSSQQGHTLKEVLMEIEKLTGRKFIIKHLPERKEYIPVCILDISKTKELLDFNPQVTLTGGIEKTLSYYLDLLEESAKAANNAY
jgi:UDP-glucose 4-epimerase